MDGLTQYTQMQEAMSKLQRAMVERDHAAAEVITTQRHNDRKTFLAAQDATESAAAKFVEAASEYAEFAAANPLKQETKA